MLWSEERVEVLKKWWAEGLSASQIAGRLGGVTRNAVIGKVHRLGLAYKVRNKGPAPRPRPAMRRARKDAQRRADLPDNPVQKLKGEPWVPQIEPFIPPHERKPILVRKADGFLHANDELTETSCRYPCGEVTDPDFGFCGKTKVPGLPYCEAHARIAFKALNPQPPAASQPAPVAEERAKYDEKVAA